MSQAGSSTDSKGWSPFTCSIPAARNGCVGLCLPSLWFLAHQIALVEHRVEIVAADPNIDNDSGVTWRDRRYLALFTGILLGDR